MAAGLRESHVGGWLAMAMRFAGYDGVMVRGIVKTPACLIIGGRTLEIVDVHYLCGQDVLATGKWLRRIHRSHSGHRSILRIGPAGEKQAAFAGISVDTYRHVGRLGGGAIMGAKNLKGVTVIGDTNLELPQGSDYQKLYKTIYQEMTQSDVMRKYPDLGTAENMIPLNEMHAVPWRNMQATRDDAAAKISGEKFAQELLLRKTACAGYSFDQKSSNKDLWAAIEFFLEEERRRVQLTCMVSRVFARNVYTRERLQACLSVVGREQVAVSLPAQTKRVQAERWRLKFASGHDPAQIKIPKRFSQITTWQGPIDQDFMDGLSRGCNRTGTKCEIPAQRASPLGSSVAARRMPSFGHGGLP